MVKSLPPHLLPLLKKLQIYLALTWAGGWDRVAPILPNMILYLLCELKRAHYGHLVGPNPGKPCWDTSFLITNFGQHLFTRKTTGCHGMTQEALFAGAFSFPAAVAVLDLNWRLGIFVTT